MLPSNRSFIQFVECIPLPYNPAYKATHLYPDIKAMALYPNESVSVRKIKNYKKLYF